MDWRQVEHVETHGGDAGQESFDVGEGAVSSWIGGGGSREELVPGGVAGAFAVNPEMQLLMIAGGKGQVGMLRGEVDDLVAQRKFIFWKIAFGEAIEISCRLGEELAVGAFGALRGLMEQDRARLQGKGNVLRLGGGVRCVGVWLGREALLQVGAPGVEVIDPCLEGVEPVAELVDREGDSPEIVGEGRQRRGAPVFFAGVPVKQASGDVVVAVTEDCRGHGDGVAEDSLCGIAAAIDLRLDFFDDDTFPAFDRFHITQVFQVNGAFPWYSGGVNLRYVLRKLKVVCSLGRCAEGRERLLSGWAEVENEAAIDSLLGSLRCWASRGRGVDGR
jgi:hypothetical protein